MNLGSNHGRDVEVLDGTSMSVRIPVNKGSISGIVASPDGSRLLVTNYGGDSVSIIDTHSHRVVETIAGVDEPFAIAMAGADRAFVTSVSAAYDAIGVIDPTIGVLVATHPVALSVSDLAVSADGKRVYIARTGAGSSDIAVLDTADGRMGVIDVIDIATVAGTTTECVRVSPDGARVYVGVNGPAGGQVVVIDTGQAIGDGAEAPTRWRRKKPSAAAGRKGKRARQNRGPAVIGTIEIGLAVRDVAISPNGALVYVVSSAPEFAVIDVVDTGTDKITATRKITEIGGLITRLTLSGDGDRAYLVSDDGVTVLCTLTQDVVESIEVAAPPSCVVESIDGESLYIADYSGGITVAPIVANVAGIEQPALESKRSVDLFAPDLLQYDAALV